ncbi:MAG: glycosyltransferase family 2 protein [Tabrizicola sp.]|uniref:glycosyltransferase family 2 protein n=1 Tax=Tabrizicola sp. TaxID=2005166 RepID=UPI002AB864D2|nr:glycosyltransferase family 2 protein [Tabrizicola sp.]MDZ4087675.1 glycosyltransferase family 2 protein [Tabrizicola sp.]
MTGLAGALLAFKLRTRRQRLLWRAWRKRSELRALQDRTVQIAPQDVLCFLCVRNEAARLPHFLRHHRAQGVRHFLAVDNASTDGTANLLRDQPDVSLWATVASYKASRFGMDWLTWLMMQYGSGHWCLTLDADELLIYPYWQTRPLPALTGWLDTQGRDSFGALTVDMYPEGPVSEGDVGPGDDPTDHLGWFDTGNYQVQVQPRMRNLWVQGGARARAFFAVAPRRAPTLNKTPLVRWHWRYAYVNSTHALLPPRLNEVYATDGGELTSGILLHTKFLPGITERSAEEKARGEHFGNAGQYAAYYDHLTANPVLHTRASTRYTGWRQMEALGLMSRGGWI